MRGEGSDEFAAAAEACLRGVDPDGVAVAPCQAVPDGADGLLGCPAVGPCHAGDGDGDVGARSRQGATSHLARDLWNTPVPLVQRTPRELLCLILGAWILHSEIGQPTNGNLFYVNVALAAIFTCAFALRFFLARMLATTAAFAAGAQWWIGREGAWAAPLEQKVRQVAAAPRQSKLWMQLRWMTWMRKSAWWQCSSKLRHCSASSILKTNKSLHCKTLWANRQIRAKN